VGKVIEIEDALWARLSAVARRERKSPRGVVRALIQDFIEADLDRKLDAAISKDVQRSGYGEEDAIRLVRGYRSQARSGPAARARESSGQYRRRRGV
jgi:predicted transcriptional regulator